MSAQREEFEAFWRREMNIEVMDLHRTEYPMTAPKDQQYKCHETNRAWITWQASRATALESVEALLEDKRREAWGQTEVEWAFGDALEAVELLKEQS